MRVTPRPSPPPSSQARRVMVVGATGTIGRATVRELAARGHRVVCLARRAESMPESVEMRLGDVQDRTWVLRDGFRGEAFDAVLSCLASRSGVPQDAWAVDHRAQSNVLAAAQASGVGRMVLLSAICVQKPRLAFQHAKLCFEAELAASGVPYSIVRATAFFKSLSGQVERVRRGKPFLLFGDGRLTACKPISDADLARYLADCLEREDSLNRILPIGGPGPAITPREQGERLFALLGRAPKFRQVPVGLLGGIGRGLALLGHVSPALAAKAELARIGHYYATESMLVLDPATGRYDAEATPSTGSDTLFEYYARLIRGEAKAERGDHAVF